MEVPKKVSEWLYFTFRIIIGVLFLMHGLGKLPGVMSGETGLFTLIGMACIIEIVAGFLIILGLFVRPVSVITAVEMLVAFFYVHVRSKETINPLANNGEPAVLFFVSFLVLIAYGAGKFGIDRYIRRR